MTPAEVRALIRVRGTTIAALSVQHGYPRGRLNSALHDRQYPKHHDTIARFLGLALHDVWPEWYVPGHVYRPTIPLPATLDAILTRVAAGERLYRVCKEPGQPTRELVMRYAKADPDFGARYAAAMTPRTGRKVGQERLDRALEELRNGARLDRLTIVGSSTLTEHRKRDRALDLAVRKILDRPRRFNVVAFAGREEFVRALRSDEVYAVAESAVPRNLPSEMRDDVKSDLVVALLTGEVVPTGAAVAARKLASRWNRMFLHHDASFEADFGDGLTLAGLVADSSFDASGTGIRVTTAGW